MSKRGGVTWVKNRKGVQWETKGYTERQDIAKRDRVLNDASDAGRVMIYYCREEKDIYNVKW